MRSRTDRTIRTGKSGDGRGREVAGIVLIGVAIFSLLSVFSLQTGSATVGPIGVYIGLGIYAIVGVGAYPVTLGLATLGVRCLRGKAIKWKSVETLGVIGIGFCAAMLLHLWFGTHRLRGFTPGGAIGEYGGELIASLFGRIGLGLIALTGLFASLVVATPISFSTIAEWAASAGQWIVDGVYNLVGLVFPEATDDDEHEAARDDRGREDTEPSLEIKEEKPQKKRRREDEAQLVRTRGEKEKDAKQLAAASEDEGIVEGEMPAPIIVEKKATKKKKDNKIEVIDLTGPQPVDKPGKIELVSAPDAKQQEAKVLVQPQIVEPIVAKKPDPALLAPKEPARPKMDYIPAKGGYQVPDLSLLDYEESPEDELDRAAMLALAERLQKTLADYGVKGSVVQIHPGPVVTMYEFVPAPGTKLSKITALSNDLAMSLEALRVRIVAPIPGKGSVGIEVPNKGRATVWLKEILIDENIHKSRSKLTLGLGKDIAGAPVAVDLAKMPHLLVAGTTGSGKSVAVNGMICSVLFNSTPDEVRMIMIDPKMVELSIYEGIPHLLLPVVTDPKKANLALRWAVDEMERRYEMVSKAGVRDLATFNKKIEKHIADGPIKLEPKKIKIFVDGEDGQKQEIEVDPDEMSVVAAGGEVTDDIREEISQAQALLSRAKQQAAEELPDRKLPLIVVIIDEFADLMMVAPKDVETSVARIAQKARAVGIHLILATQRPSVDVITGLIKANFPSRMAFQVASKIDSRTILDQQGAENLLGQGDMLFTDRGQALRRIHGALVTDVEIRRLVDFLKEQGKPVYDMDILKPREEEGGDEAGGGGPSPSGDQMYDQAVRIVCETRIASVSMLQRRLQIGFNRAARLLEQMEKEGIVGAPNGSKPREVIANAL